ncbi:MAG: dTDP-4-dehydrorhamnose 3,5-epimerase [Gemmatimonadota bacterium]
MKIEETSLPGVLLIGTDRFADDRGWFAELWNAERYRAAGIDTLFVQSNVSRSGRGVLRGMHFQHPRAQAKLVTVLLGRIFDVAVDIRPGSATRGRWFGQELSAENRLQLYIPAGFAHGFLVQSDEALVHYDCSDVYDAASDGALAWNDPDVGIAWPEPPATVSAKDRRAPRLAELNL